MNWIVGYTPLRQAPALAMFDGFGHVDVPAPVHAFIEELVLSLQNDEDARARLRVVLLGYDAARLENRSIDFQRCVLEYVDAGEIRKWFEKQNPGQPEYRYSETVDEIESRVPDGNLRMRVLCNLVHAANRAF